MEQALSPYKSKYFYNDFTTSLRDLFTKSNYSDVTLVSDDQIQFQAHKFVLSACSPVLKNLLLNNSHSHPLIYLRGVKQQELGSILQFMYHGEAAIHLDSINMFLENAKDLQIKQLADCFVKDKDVNRENDPECDGVGNISNHENVNNYINNTKSISSTIDEILSLDLAAYSPDMDGPDSVNQLPKCGECGAGYRWKKDLVRHIRNRHEGVRYSCNQCEYQATTQKTLKAHKEAVHEGVKYLCNQCEYQATT